MLDTFLQLAGRAHPMLLHLPIGMLVALVCLEVLALARLIELDTRVRAVLVCLVFLSAAASVASGLLLEREPAYTGGTGWTDTLSLHKWLGIGFGVITLFAVLSLVTARTRKAYPLLLLLSVAAMFPVGHLGATMTHGEGFLTEPLFPRQPEPLRGSAGSTDPALLPASSRGIYPEQIAPILERYCVSCHGSSKMQGKLALHTPEAILAGGATGTAIEPGDPDNSEMLVRMLLPLTSRDHMPPKVRPQPDEAAIDLIRRWIAAGAPFEGGELQPTGRVDPEEPAAADPPGASLPADPSGLAPRPTPSVAQNSDVGPAAPSPEAITALRTAQVHVEFIDPAHRRLWVSFDGVSGVDDATCAKLLGPVSDSIQELSLAGTTPGPITLSQVAGMSDLRRLSLARTASRPQDIATLTGLSKLEELNLSSTSLDGSVVEPLCVHFPSLQRVFLWGSGLTDETLSELRTRRPSLVLVVDSPAGLPLETEPALTLTSDAPPPVPAAPH